MWKKTIECFFPKIKQNSKICWSHFLTNIVKMTNYQNASKSLKNIFSLTHFKLLNISRLVHLSFSFLHRKTVFRHQLFYQLHKFTLGFFFWLSISLFPSLYEPLIECLPRSKVTIQWLIVQSTQQQFLFLAPSYLGTGSIRNSFSKSFLSFLKFLWCALHIYQL